MSNTSYDYTNDTADRASRSIDRALETSQQAARRATERASELAHRGLDAVRESSQVIRDRALRASDQSVQYIKHEPVKSMLFAAVAGATIMGLISLMSRSRDRY